MKRAFRLWDPLATLNGLLHAKNLRFDLIGSDDPALELLIRFYQVVHQVHWRWFCQRHGLPVPTYCQQTQEVEP